MQKVIKKQLELNGDNNNNEKGNLLFKNYNHILSNIIVLGIFFTFLSEFS